jgi:predicted nucleotidyltransferase
VVDGQMMDEIVRRIVSVVQPEKIVLFGSRARGDARPSSDLDLLVIAESDEPRFRRSSRVYRIF